MHDQKKTSRFPSEKANCNIKDAGSLVLRDREKARWNQTSEHVWAQGSSTPRLHRCRGPCLELLGCGTPQPGGRTVPDQELGSIAVKFLSVERRKAKTDHNLFSNRQSVYFKTLAYGRGGAYVGDDCRWLFMGWCKCIACIHNCVQGILSTAAALPAPLLPTWYGHLRQFLTLEMANPILDPESKWWELSHSSGEGWASLWPMTWDNWPILLISTIGHP